MLVERLDKTGLTRRQRWDAPGGIAKWFEWPDQQPSILDVPEGLARKLTEILPAAKYFRLFTGKDRTPLSEYSTKELEVELALRGGLNTPPVLKTAAKARRPGRRGRNVAAKST